MTKDLPEPVIAGAKDMIAVKRLGAPADIAAAASYLTSDEAGFITGQVVAVDGGMTMA